MAVKIIVDSASDIPVEYEKMFDMDILCLHVVDGDSSYKEREEMDYETVYDGQAQGKSFSTSQVSLDDILECMEKYGENPDGAIFITLSSGISGTFSAGEMALKQYREKNPDTKFQVFDSKGATVGEALLAIRAGMMSKDGMSVDEIMEGLTYMRDNSDYLLNLEELDTLYKGGRLSKVSYVVGGALKVSPILTFERQHGKLESLAKERGAKKAYAKVRSMMDERSTVLDKNQTIVVAHGRNPEGAEEWKAALEADGFTDVRMGRVGAVIGAHTGRTLKVVVYMTNVDPKYAPYMTIPQI